MRRDVVETNGQALLTYLKSLRGSVHLCVEEGDWSQWLAELLAPRIREFVVVQPERRNGSKSDRIDADDLSGRIHSGKLGRVVFNDRGQFRALRERARVYRVVREDVVSRGVRAEAPDCRPRTKRLGVHEIGGTLIAAAAKM